MSHQTPPLTTRLATIPSTLVSYLPPNHRPLFARIHDEILPQLPFAGSPFVADTGFRPEQPSSEFLRLGRCLAVDSTCVRGRSRTVVAIWWRASALSANRTGRNAGRAGLNCRVQTRAAGCRLARFATVRSRKYIGPVRRSQHRPEIQRPR